MHLTVNPTPPLDLGADQTPLPLMPELVLTMTGAQAKPLKPLTSPQPVITALQ